MLMFAWTHSMLHVSLPPGIYATGGGARSQLFNGATPPSRSPLRSFPFRAVAIRVHVAWSDANRALRARAPFAALRAGSRRKALRCHEALGPDGELPALSGTSVHSSIPAGRWSADRTPKPNAAAHS